MNRNKRGVMPEITRAIYKDIKKYDRQQFTEFCKYLYGYGFEDGRESVPGVDIETVYAAIDEIKGIGPTTSAKVITMPWIRLVTDAAMKPPIAQ